MLEIVALVLIVVAVLVLSMNRSHYEGWLINYGFRSSNDTGLRGYECDTYGRCAGKMAILAGNARADAFDKQMLGPPLPLDG